ncbi:MAG: (Fe-S)-binding protein [Candidatus Thorarchaeota archaeon]
MDLASLKHYDEFFICAYCAYCVDNQAACPTFLSVRHEIVTGRGKMITARNLAQGLLKEDEGLDALTRGLFECTFCKACEDECLVDIPLIDVYTELKTLVQDRLPKYTQKLFRNLQEHHNIYGLDQEDRNLWTSGSIHCEEEYQAFVNQPAEIGYFIGCVGSYSGRAAGGPAAIVKLAKLAGEKISVFSPDEFCCGNPYWLGGNLEAAKRLAEHNLKVIKNLGIKTLFVSCAGCYRVIGKVYPELTGKPLPFALITHMEFLIKLLKKGTLPLEKGNPVAVSFKDPCELGRHCNVYDEARDLISLLPGVENRELANNRENALCCGAGGLLKVNNPKMAGEIAGRLIKQMEEVGTEYCLNACPSCLLNIDQYLRRKNSPIKSIDIAQLVHDRTKLV